MHMYQQLINLGEASVDAYHADFAKKFDSTVILVSTPKFKDKPMYLKVRGHSLRFQTNEMQDEILVDPRENKHEIYMKPLLPKIGYYNVGNMAINLYKSPQRQWRSSLCNGIYTIGSVINKEYNRQLDQISWLDVGNAVVNPVYIHMDKITHPLFSNIALDHRFAISTHKGKNFFTYRGCGIGLLDYNNYTIEPLFSHLKQEIADFLQRNGIRVWKLKVT